MVLGKSLESLGLQGDLSSPSQRKSILNIHWKDWCWSWSSNTLATWCKELTHWKRPWCWERLKAGGEGDNRGWDGCTASPTQWTWVWASSGELVMDREAWHAAVHGDAKSWTWLSDWIDWEVKEEARIMSRSFGVVCDWGQVWRFIMQVKKAFKLFLN